MQDNTYTAAVARYDAMRYNRSGHSGLMLPAVSLGLWHGFGQNTSPESQRDLLRCAFDLGITHFDLANNYGPPYGEAERTLGLHLKRDFAPYRDELCIATKAGWDMWPGPYGDWGGKKYLVASLDQSLARMGLDYVDIFYHHRPDPETPLEETLGALDLLVRQGKALYVGVSQYPDELTGQAIEIFQKMGTPFVIHQARYNLLERWVEEGLLDTLRQSGVGCIAFSPLAQGQLSGKYLSGIPADSRAARDPRYLTRERITAENQAKISALAGLAAARGQSLAQLALAWVLRRPEITSVLIGASRPAQLVENVAALKNTAFSPEEEAAINAIV